MSNGSNGSNSADASIDRTLADTSGLVTSGALSAVDLVEASLARIEATDGDIGAFASVQGDAARTRAAELDAIMADSGEAVGPLHGIPIALKDLIFTNGVPAVANSDALGDFVPDRDAVVVERLLEAGAIVIGKTNTHELAFGVSCPASHNPWDRGRMTGGSSGGSAAAIAARQVYGALGTDTGGSVRIPSNYCGTTGIKTTRGLVPRSGVHLISWTYDTVGPMAQTAEDCLIMLEVMAGRDPADPYSSSTPMAPALEPEACRIGIASDSWLAAAPIADDVRAAMVAAADVLHDVVADTSIVDLPEWEQHGEHGSVIVFAEAAAMHARLLAERGDRFGEEVRGILEAGSSMPATAMAIAEDVRLRLEHDWLAVFDGVGAVDAVLCPVTPNQVLPHGTESIDGLPLIPATTQFTFAVNGAGLPAIALPGGFDSDGLPVGLQLIGRPFSERTLAAIGAAFQAQTKHHEATPPRG